MAETPALLSNDSPSLPPPVDPGRDSHRYCPPIGCEVLFGRAEFRLGS